MPNMITSFTLTCPTMICDPFIVSRGYIQRLEIECGDNITKELGDMITSCFPRLVVLIISGRVSENIDIALNNDSLKIVTFLHMRGKFVFSLKSARQTNPQHYLFEDNKITDSTYEDITTLPKISFTSVSQKELCIHYNSFNI